MVIRLAAHAPTPRHPGELKINRFIFAHLDTLGARAWLPHRRCGWRIEDAQARVADARRGRPDWFSVAARPGDPPSFSWLARVERAARAHCPALAG